MRASRTLLGALGVLTGLYGAYLWLSRQELDQIKSAVIWLAGGVILHDGAIGLSVLVVAAVAARVLPAAAKAPATVGMMVLGSVTLLAVPMLGSFGAKDDNPTLLDRNYGVGWLVFFVLVLVAVVVASVLRARSTATPAPSDHDQHDQDDEDDVRDGDPVGGRRD
ncbi:hypothetical protein BH11ACT8_BH11ACT8_24770 [soil metagenome]